MSQTNRSVRLIIAALAALSLGLAVVAARISTTSDNTTGRLDDVRRTAGAMASAFLSYDYRRLPETKSRVLRLATGTFKKQYNEAFDGGLDTIYKNTKAVSTVRDLTIYVGDVTDREATALVEVTALVSATAGRNRSQDYLLQFQLVHTSSGWLVDGVTDLSKGVVATVTPNATTTSTTP